MIELSVSIVICAHTEARWEQTRAAVKSVLDQRPRPAQLLLIIDHNASLAARAQRELAGVSVLEATAHQGCRAHVTRTPGGYQPITVFLDDDAEARPGWLESLVEPYSRSEVVATGGSVHPWWPGLRPAWLPPTFDWVVGCSYLGLPDTVSPVRNPIGANMSMRTGTVLDIGGFDAAVGRVGSRPRGCEETELAIRLTTSRPESVILYVPAAGVDHHVGKERHRFRYFLRRCWHEGLSKATVVRLVGSSPGLECERRHVAVVIPAALLRDLRNCAPGDLTAPMRIISTIGGLATVTAGYMAGSIGLPGKPRRKR